MVLKHSLITLSHYLVLVALETLHPIPLAVVQSYGLAHEFELMVWAARHLPEDSHPGTITELLNLAIRLFSHAVTELKWHGIFAYAPDPVSLKLARTAVWVYKVSDSVLREGCHCSAYVVIPQNCPHVEVDERAEVQSLLEKLGEAYEAAANTANNAAYHARFFKYMGYRMSRRDGVDSKKHGQGNHPTNDSKMKPSVANITAEQVVGPGLKGRSSSMLLLLTVDSIRLYQSFSTSRRFSVIPSDGGRCTSFDQLGRLLNIALL
jgi:hypothetical protein